VKVLDLEKKYPASSWIRLATANFGCLDSLFIVSRCRTVLLGVALVPMRTNLHEFYHASRRGLLYGRSYVHLSPSAESSD
jgi:hypothetical protein